MWRQAAHHAGPAFVRGDTAMTAADLKTVNRKLAPGDAGITGLTYLAYTVARCAPA